MVRNNIIIRLVFLFPFLVYGEVKTDKLLLYNSNTYSGMYIKSIESKVFFKVNQNIEVDSVHISDIQLLKLSTGNIIVKDGVITGNTNIMDLAVRNAKRSIVSPFKWKTLGAGSVPSSLLSGALFWNLSKRFSQSNDGIAPAGIFGFASVLSFPFTLSNINIMVSGLPKRVKDNEKKRYEDFFIREVKSQRRQLVNRGIVIGLVTTTMFAYLAQNVKIK
jgi:hypothetical protein